MPYFFGFSVALYLILRGTLKSDKIFVVIIPLNLVLRGIFPNIFSNFLKILNTPQLGVEWYNKDKIFAALISVFACIIYKNN